MEDKFLIEQVLAGNKNAFRLLVIRYQRPLFSFYRKFGFTPQRIDELVQDVFLKVFNSLATFDNSKGTFSCWTFSIAKNMALNELKKKGEMLESEEKLEQALLEMGADENLDSILDKKISNVKVQSLVKKIPNPFKIPVILSYIEELSIDEIANIENCSTGTVKSRIHRGKLFLRDLVLCEGI
jgi:RNA polymerase sigma-70 factor (ECF subfamily)